MKIEGTSAIDEHKGHEPDAERRVSKTPTGIVPNEGKRPSTHTAAIEYRPAIDGLRAVAVLSVFIFHLNHRWLPGGFVGVDVFFVISGFLITSIIWRDCQAGRFSLARFYQRRVARIYPAFVAVGAATLSGAYFFYAPQDLSSSGANLTAAAASVANIKFMLQGDYFKLSPDAQPFLHCWSLSLEEQFYFVLPVSLLLLSRFAPRALSKVVAGALVLSFFSGIVLTHTRPVWAFYLLPTRAWELLAGSMLALYGASRRDVMHPHLWNPLAGVGLGLVLASFLVIHEGRDVPGWIVLMPVAGTLLVLGPNTHPTGFAERMLASDVMVAVGKRSYSIYLWHWPVFSFVDYALYLSPGWQRLTFKAGLSLGFAVASYRWLEDPARRYLSWPQRQRVAFVGVAAALAALVVAGISTRETHYLNANAEDIAHGGRVIGEDGGAGSIMLLGDSNGSMYGTAIRQLATELGYRLTVLSVAAGDPLPIAEGPQNKLWVDSLAVVTRTKPQVVVLACNWIDKLRGRRDRIRLALYELGKLTPTIVLTTMPPVLPPQGSREGIRNGARPPFEENPATREERRSMNEFLKSLRGPQVQVLDIEPLFVEAEGRIRFVDGLGRMLYQDFDHLSHAGAMLVMPMLRDSIAR